MSGRIQNGVRAVWQSLALALPIGLAGGVVGTAFHIAVEQVTALRAAQGWLLWLLPIAGLGITALYQVLRCQGLGTDDVLRTVQQGKPLPLALTPAIFLGAVLTPCAAALPDGRALPCKWAAASAGPLAAGKSSRPPGGGAPPCAAWQRCSRRCSAHRWPRHSLQ